MNTCAVQNVATLRAADHICVWDKSRWPFRYTHHGVVFEEGASEEDIVIAHVWSSEPGFRASQKDSRFRLTSLAEFLNGRPVRDMRRVQYNSSLLGNALSKLGEVHGSRSDPPPIVLARCRFLLGLGQGHFSIVTLNCEHVALWCKTGVLWSKQLFQKSYERTPYVPEKNSEHVLAPLKATLAILKGEVRQRNNRLLALKGRRVYLRVGDTKFVKRLGDGKLYLVHNDPKERDMAFRHVPTSFVLNVDIEAYNCVTVMFRLANASGSVSDSFIAGSSSSVGRSASSCSVVTASRSNLSVRTASEADEEEYQERQTQLAETRPRAVTNSAETRDRLNQRFEYIYSGGNSVKLVARRSYHRESLFQFEYSWDGELQSRRNRRWYVGAQTRDSLLRTYNSRDHATRFEIVDADLVDSQSVEIDFRAVEASAKPAVPTEDKVTPSSEVVPPANANVDANLSKENKGGETTDQEEILGDADSKCAPSEA